MQIHIKLFLENRKTDKFMEFVGGVSRAGSKQVITHLPPTNSTKLTWYGSCKRYIMQFINAN